MPELPEVETIRRQLQPLYQGETIRETKIHTPYLLKNCSKKEFSQAISGKKLERFSRAGKFLIFECQDVYPVFHLGMSGIFLKDKAESAYPQHIHVELHFESGKQLFFQDARKFGKIWLYREYPQLPKLGIDPTTTKLTSRVLQNLLNKRQMNMKAFLLDQSIIAGIGNIYASEILFLAKISPLRKANEVTESEIPALRQAIDFVLHSAIEKFGTTYSAFRTPNGQPGENQHFLKVYQRHGESCVNCSGQIKKIVLGSRSTFFCENCQK